MAKDGYKTNKKPVVTTTDPEPTTPTWTKDQLDALLNALEERVRERKAEAEKAKGEKPKADPNKEKPKADPNKEKPKAEKPKAEKPKAESDPKGTKPADPDPNKEKPKAEKPKTVVTTCCSSGIANGPGKAYRYWDYQSRCWLLTPDIWRANQASNGEWDPIWVMYKDGEIHHILTNDELRKYCP